MLSYPKANKKANATYYILDCLENTKLLPRNSEIHMASPNSLRAISFIST